MKEYSYIHNITCFQNKYRKLFLKKKIKSNVIYSIPILTKQCLLYLITTYTRTSNI